MEKYLKEIEQSFEELRDWNNAQKILPKEKGIYGIYLSKEFNFPFGIKPGKGGCIYVGLAENKSGGLYKRIYTEHFNTRNSGRSAFRRTLGSVLKKELGLKCYIRDEKSRYRDTYRFDVEQILTDWITQNTRLAWHKIIADANVYRDLEKMICENYQPCLVKEHWNNPFNKFLKDLKDQCIVEARKNGNFEPH